MASFQVIGFIDNVRFLPNNGGCLLFLSEFKKGYRKANGEIVDDKTLPWKVIFKQGLVNYISNHFSNGMLVEVKGEVLPYAIEKQDIVQGYSVIGQTINLFSFPRASVRAEQKLIRDSEMHGDGTPDIDEYNRPDF